MTIKLVETGFSIIPEGNYIFKIVEVEYKQDFGKMVITMATKQGAKYIERYTLIKGKNEVNEGAMKAFSFMAKTALNDFSLDEIDENDLIGCYLKGNIEHTVVESTKDPDKTVTFTKLTNIEPALGFEESEPAAGDPLGALDDL